MFLQAQGIDNNYRSVSRVSWSHGLSNNDGGVRRGQGICDAYEGLETTPKAAGDRKRAQGIYDNDGGVGGGILERTIKEQQRMRRKRIYHASKGSKTTTEAAAD